MAKEGRIEGRVSPDGKRYELWQHGVVRQSIPIEEVHANAGLKRAIQRNKWESLP